ncbi:MAG: glycosyltransferase family 4 protein [Sphingomonas bacterium]
MRLLTVTHFFEQHGGGIERVAGHLNRCFTAQGHETSWAASAGDLLPDAQTASPVAMPCFNAIERLSGLPMPIPGPRALYRLATAIRTSDAVIVHDALYLSSIAAMLLARWHGKPITLIQHIAAIPFSNSLLKRVMALANRLVTHPMLRAAHQVIFISDTTRAAFVGVRFRVPPLLLFNGVESSLFRSVQRKHDSTLLFVGRFVEKKGLSIIREMAAARPERQVVLAGNGPIDPDAWGLPNVRVLRDRSGALLAALYQVADALILPSVGEGFPLVIQEAMACGLPVICGEEASRADPGASAWLYPIDIDLSDPSGSAERLITAVDAVGMTPGDRAAMSAYAIATYDWGKMAEQIVAQFGSSPTRQPTVRAASSSAA